MAGCAANARAQTTGTLLVLGSHAWALYRLQLADPGTATSSTATSSSMRASEGKGGARQQVTAAQQAQRKRALDLLGGDYEW